jgi:hypothetical protein
MRVLVCGGRDYDNRAKVFRILRRFELKFGPIDCLIQGEAKGADSIAKEWAEVHKVKIDSYPADWKKYGKRAGYLRNKQMLEDGKPDVVIAFPGRKGTAMMIQITKEAISRGKKIKLIEIT